MIDNVGIKFGSRFERIADRSTNIAERTVYLVTGKMEEIGSSKY